MSNIIQNMRAARNTPLIALQQYIVLRSKASEDFICVFEGFEDYPYYDTIFRRIRDDFKYRPLIVKGKDQVLGLRNLLSKRESPDTGKVAYFIDRDFDGFKGHDPSADTYCTSGYSIENNLCCPPSLPELLLSEFECLNTEDEETVPSISKLFDKRLGEFSQVMKEANKLIYYARKNNIRLSGIENQITKYIHISLDKISPKETDILKLIGWPATDDASLIPGSIADFDGLDPLRDWRGKFVLAIYTELLHKLKDDRCSQAPKYFKRKSGIKFNPKGDIIRTLAILAPVPACLRSFTTRLGTPESPY